jgi:hypothetical protein
VLSDEEIERRWQDAYTNPGEFVAIYGRDFADEREDLLHSLREARRERDAARAALRDAIAFAEHRCENEQTCPAHQRWRRALGEAA